QAVTIMQCRKLQRTAECCQSPDGSKQPPAACAAQRDKSERRVSARDQKIDGDVVKLRQHPWRNVFRNCVMQRRDRVQQTQRRPEHCTSGYIQRSPFDRRERDQRGQTDDAEKDAEALYYVVGNYFRETLACGAWPGGGDHGMSPIGYQRERSARF